MIPVRTRVSVWGDVEVLHEIERTCPRPWPVGEIGRARRERGACCVVATLASQVAGYVVYRLDSHLVTLDRIAVHAAWRRLGIGRTLVRRVTRSLSRDRPRIVVMVPDDLIEMHLFLRSLRFRASGVGRNAFEDADGYWFERTADLTVETW